ncbi:MAG: hypothetical protein MRY49_02440 [Candidatus Pacebacteria bacterium]|nr:hypothetical protein [Candidatus Paceibacterota bacterium]
MKIFSFFILSLFVFILPASTFAQGNFGERVPVVDEEHIDISMEILEKLNLLLEKELEQDPLQEFEAKSSLADETSTEIEFVRRGYKGYLGNRYLPTEEKGPENLPLFEQNLSSFYQSVAKSEFNKFMLENFGYNFETGELNTPGGNSFEKEYLESVARVLIENKDSGVYSRNYTLDLHTGSKENTKAFLEGDFTKGGWDAWYHLTQNPDNNIFGILDKAQQEIYERQSSAIYIEEQKLNQGGGFHATEDIYGNVITPSSVNESKINRALSTCQRSLELSDEFVGETYVTDRLAEMCERLNGALNDLETGLLKTSVIDIFEDIFNLDFSELLDRFIGDIKIGGFNYGNISI